MDGQHLPDVEIPIMEISPGWPAEAVRPSKFAEILTLAQTKGETAL